MLKLSGITKEYVTGEETVHALKGIDLEFRKSEFVSILGQSGCGKTTMLNIIGGLDRYTAGDLIINGVSTKQYKNEDWDTYRNHSIGFVFQSYNLIPHQSVLANVELALTLSGVGKSERRARAKEALKSVGLESQMNKRPNQLSGGQMQRVAIARALVNDPEILLADEPTGALDSETSVQVMEILKNISKDKLIIMVTHNPELAEKYSTRIIKLLDGTVVDDSNPITEEETANSEADATAKTDKKKMRKPSMSLFTALSLSLKNLMTKKARTFLTSFAGSIGIIGIALVLSISNGISLFISNVQEETLSSYPLTIEKTTVDLGSMMTSMANKKSNAEEHELDKIYSNDVMSEMLSSLSGDIKVNNLYDFKKYVEKRSDELTPLVTDIQYGYSTTLNIYKTYDNASPVQVNPTTLFNDLMGNSTAQMQSSNSNFGVFKELIDNKDFLERQYDVVYGKMPEEYNEVVLMVNKNNEITDMCLYALGLKDQTAYKQLMKDIFAGKKVEATPVSFSYEDILNQEYKLMVNSDYFQKDGNIWTDKSSDTAYVNSALEKAIPLKIVGIIRPSEDATVSQASGGIGYTHALTEALVKKVNESEIVKEQQANPDVDILSGIKFNSNSEKPSLDDITLYVSSLPAEQQAQVTEGIKQMRLAGMSDDMIAEKLSAQITVSTSNTYDGNLEKFGVADLDNPSSINFYSKDFKSKDKIEEIIAEYNKEVGKEKEIEYTDYVGILMSSVTTIINVISYILIAFVAISLVVSSIMIGIITYISVLERTKEIGILRSIGASKRDISRVFNAETLIVGFVAGIIGIGISLLLTIPINAIIKHFADISAAAVLPVMGAVILVVISMLLTYIAGLIPAKIASKKDPVEALRTE